MQPKTCHTCRNGLLPHFLKGPILLIMDLRTNDPSSLMMWPLAKIFDEEQGHFVVKNYTTKCFTSSTRGQGRILSPTQIKPSSSRKTSSFNNRILRTTLLDLTMQSCLLKYVISAPSKEHEPWLYQSPQLSVNYCTFFPSNCLRTWKLEPMHSKYWTSLR